MALKCWAIISCMWFIHFPPFGKLKDIYLFIYLFIIYLLCSETVVRAMLGRWCWCGPENAQYCSDFCYRIICIMYWSPCADLEKVPSSPACGLKEMFSLWNTVNIAVERAGCLHNIVIFAWAVVAVLPVVYFSCCLRQERIRIFSQLRRGEQ